MESHICQTKTQAVLRPPSSLHKTGKALQNLAFPSTRLSFKHEHRLVVSPRLKLGLVGGCAKLGSSSGCVAEVERELEGEVNLEGENWIVEMGKLRSKCKERKGMVELLECLEMEAIMGDDEGRQPNDYNRRARIFDKSSKVFMALKGCNTTTAPEQS